MKIDRGPSPYGRGRPEGRALGGKLIGVVLVAGAVGAAAYFGVFERARAAIFVTEVTTGEVTTVSASAASVQLTASGYVVAESSAKVAAKVPGRVAELYVKVGDSIERGAKVARLEDVDFKSTLASARAKAAAARARIPIARGSLAEAKVTLDREKPLSEKGAIPKAEIQDLEQKVQTLNAAIRATEAEARAADAEAASLQVQLNEYVVTSPVAGTVVAKLVDVGEGVSPVFGSPGVIEVVDMASLVVEVDVPEARMAQAAVGAPVEITLDSYPDKRFRGTVKEIGRRVNRAKATVPVKVQFGDRPPEVLPEMSSRVSFLSAALDEQARKAPPTRVVPSAAVVQRAGQRAVFVLDGDHVKLTPVTVGKPVGDGLALDTPLGDGTRVVLAPAAELVDGQKVKEKAR
ncbi:MAG TPA: efflux RND transporter periplasmic adaptor subunit [Kofleriaceae bacterium]|nr:efflux RND transporter periplasmic adaptor subunit [Kofleriaceae bacterium]